MQAVQKALQSSLRKKRFGVFPSSGSVCPDSCLSVAGKHSSWTGISCDSFCSYIAALYGAVIDKSNPHYAFAYGAKQGGTLLRCESDEGQANELETHNSKIEIGKRETGNRERGSESLTGKKEDRQHRQCVKRQVNQDREIGQENAFGSTGLLMSVCQVEVAEDAKDDEWNCEAQCLCSEFVHGCRVGACFC